MPPLLFLSHRIPYPPDKGDKIRSWHILRHLMRTHRVFVGTLVDDPADWAHVPALRAQCADLACFPIDKRRQKLRALLRLRPGRPLTLDYFRSPGLARWVRETVARERIERAFVFCSAMAPYALGLPIRQRIIDFIDVDSSKWTQYARETRWPARLVWAREGRTLLAFERHAARQFDHTLFVSEAECRHFRALAPESAGCTSAMRNGVDHAYFSPRHAFADPYPPGRRAIVFTGAMDYRPNIDAVLWFAREALPAIRRGRPDAGFWIVGANPAPELRALAGQDGVAVTGRVPDTRPYLAHAACAVAPLRIARGIQNKVLEAMAMARPVVATPQAFEGIAAEPGRELLLAETPEAMAEAVGAVLDGRHPALGAGARRRIELEYDWDASLAALDALWEQAPPAAALVPGRLLQPETIA